MTLQKTDCIPEQFKLEQVKLRPVVVNFNDETVTSDAGITLIAELDRKREITSRLTACFKDYREQNRIEHSVSSLIAQRVYGLVMGYEDINDHETLRHDVMFAQESENLLLRNKNQLEWFLKPYLLTAYNYLSRLKCSG